MLVAQDKTERKNLRLAKEDSEMLGKLADAEGMSESELIRSLVRGAFAKRFPNATSSPFESHEERFARDIFDIGLTQPRLRGLIDTLARVLAVELKRPDIETASTRCMLRRRHFDLKHGSPEAALHAEEQAATILQDCHERKRARGTAERAFAALTELEHAYLRAPSAEKGSK